MIITRGLGSGELLTWGYGAVPSVRYYPYCPAISAYTTPPTPYQDTTSPYTKSTTPHAEAISPIKQLPNKC